MQNKFIFSILLGGWAVLGIDLSQVHAKTPKVSALSSSPSLGSVYEGATWNPVYAALPSNARVASGDTGVIGEVGWVNTRDSATGKGDWIPVYSSPSADTDLRGASADGYTTASHTPYSS